MDFNSNHPVSGRGSYHSYNAAAAPPAVNPYGNPYMSSMQPSTTLHQSFVPTPPVSSEHDDGIGLGYGEEMMFHHPFYSQDPQSSPFVQDFSTRTATTDLGHGVPFRHQQQTHDEQQHVVGYNDTANESADSSTTEPGSFYPLPTLTPPQLYGSSVSAVAYDVDYQAIYVASHCHTTSSITTSGHHHHHVHAANPSLYAASMLVTHSTRDGMLYSSCAGHPQASTSTLQQLYHLLYQGIGATTAQKTHPPSNMLVRIPSHAFRPPYGRTTPNATTPAASTPPTQPALNEQQMGISHLFPLGSSSQQIASVSPAAIRIHKQGGLMVVDQDMEGMLCGTLVSSDVTASGVPTRLLVGGHPIVQSSQKQNTPSSASQWNATYQGQHRQHYQQTQAFYPGHVHSLDLWQGLRPVVSRTLYRSSSSGTSNPSAGTTAMPPSSELLAVTSLATTLQGSSILAGCSDGFVRMLDGRSLREVAKVKSHAGGVVQVVTNDTLWSGTGTLVATTGYATRGSSVNYHAFPDGTVLIYDVRYLGRGGIPHPFRGMQGGPRFLTFLPSAPHHAQPVDDHGSSSSGRLMVVSGQAGGGVQILFPFHHDENDTVNQNNFWMPNMDRGESVTALSLDGQDGTLALGTSGGHVLQYKMAKYPITKMSNQNTPSDAGVVAARGSVFVPGHGLMTHPNARTTTDRPGGQPAGATEDDQDEEDSDTKQLLEVPSYIPELPALSLEPALLQHRCTGSSQRQGQVHLH